MSLELDDLGPEVLAFLTERHLATLTTLRTDGSPHVVPVGFTYEPATRLAWVKRGGADHRSQQAVRFFPRPIASGQTLTSPAAKLTLS